MAHPEMKNEEHVEGEIHPDREKAHHHRRPLVIDRVEGGREHLDAGVTDQPNRVKLQRLGRVLGIGIKEFPPLVNQRNDRLGQHDQAHS